MARDSRFDSRGGTSLEVDCISALLARHGVPNHRHSPLISEILGVSYTAANRRMNMQSSWGLDELKRIAEHFGETLQDLFSVAKADPLIDATVVINNRIVPCRIKLGEPIKQTPAGTLVAAEVEGTWRVTVADGKPAFHAHLVARLVAESASPRRRVAILEDHADMAEMIKENIEAAGFEATVFNRPSLLDDEANYDAYVLDWIIEEGSQQKTAYGLIQSLRLRDAYCPIFVLTGQISTGAADEQSIAIAMTTYGLKYFQKPLSMPILISELHSSFKRA